MRSTLKRLWASLDPEEREYLLLGLYIILGIAVLSIWLIPWLLSRQIFDAGGYTDTGQIGDTIGGISSPFIGILSAILTFLAFYIQYRANKEQKSQFKVELDKHTQSAAEQEKTWKIERFENKFYELLRLHKENVAEISIGKNDKLTTKRKAFVSMFRELKYTFFFIKDFYTKQKALGLSIEYSNIQLLRLSYIFFYSGVGNSSNIVSKSMISNPIHLYDEDFYKNLLHEMETKRDPKFAEVLGLPMFEDNDGNTINANLAYLIWGGHQSRLGHYYRHLFQTVKFVVGQDESIFGEKEKMEYLRTLRAQLSDYEQLMLYYNAMANFGAAWIENQFLTKYKMIHNLPIPLANFGITPEVRFASELQADSTLFEWLE